jgi:hypothetical protein
MRYNIECCSGCTERHFDEQGRTCHSTCEKYIAERKALTETNKNIRAEKDMQYYLGIERIKRIKNMHKE